MRSITKNYVVTGIRPDGEETTTQVEITAKPTSEMIDDLVDVLIMGQKNIASPSIDYNAFTSDSAYLDALERLADTIVITNVRASHDATEGGQFFRFSAYVSDEDRRHFVGAVAASDEEEAIFTARWHLGGELGVLPSSDINAIDEFVSCVDVNDVTAKGLAEPEYEDRRYCVGRTSGADCVVTIKCLATNSMEEDVAAAYLAASKVDPTISSTVFTSFSKAGPTRRYVSEAEYSDSGTFCEHVDGVDEDDADFQIAVGVALNECADQNELGEFIEHVVGVTGVNSNEEPTSKDEMLRAIAEFVAAHDAGKPVEDEMSRFRGILNAEQEIIDRYKARYAAVHGASSQAAATPVSQAT